VGRRLGELRLDAGAVRTQQHEPFLLVPLTGADQGRVPLDVADLTQRFPCSDTSGSDRRERHVPARRTGTNSTTLVRMAAMSRPQSSQR